MRPACFNALVNEGAVHRRMVILTTMYKAMKMQSYNDVATVGSGLKTSVSTAPQQTQAPERLSLNYLQTTKTNFQKSRR